MAAGDILKSAGLVIEAFTVKLNEDIVKGEIVRETGTGIAAAATTEKGPFFMAYEDHDYSVVEAAGGEHVVRCVVKGYVDVLKTADAGAAKKGQWLEISATVPGEVQLFTYVSADLLVMVGVAMEDTADADTTQKLRLG